MCGSVCRDYSTSNGILTSPYYPAPYTEDRDCVYTISQHSGTYIMLRILDIDINNSYYDFFYWDYVTDDTCGTDYLEIRDGQSEESPLLGKICGTDIQAPINSTQNHLWIR